MFTDSKESPEQELHDPFGIQRVGNFYFLDVLPKTLFLIGDVEIGGSFDFRKALRKSSAETIVLISDGGAVYEGLQIAAIDTHPV